MKRYLKLTILLCSVTLIASGQQQASKDDSIKFSPDETRAMIAAWESLPKYKEAADSSEKQINKLENANKSCDKVLSRCESDSKDKSELLNKQFEYNKELSGDVQNANKWRYFWRSATGWVASVAGVVIIYEEIRQ